MLIKGKQNLEGVGFGGAQLLEAPCWHEGGAACDCPAATCYGGHSVQLNSCQSQLGGMSPPRTPLSTLSFFLACFFFHTKKEKHHPVMIKVPRLQHPRLSLLAAATLSSSSSSSCCKGSSQRRLPGSTATLRKPIGYGICGKKLCEREGWATF